MTRLGKILVILIAFVSLAFAGFAIVVYYAGPNWQEMAGQIEGYKFTYTPGENPTWSAVKARGDVNIATDKNLAKVIDAVLAEKLKDVNAEVCKAEVMSVVTVKKPKPLNSGWALNYRQSKRGWQGSS